MELSLYIKYITVILLGNYRDIEALGLSGEDFDEHARLAYGARVLGGYIGDDAYILAQLNAKAEELRASISRSFPRRRSEG